MAAGSAGHHLPRSDWDEGWEHLEGAGLGHRGQESPIPSQWDLHLSHLC